MALLGSSVSHHYWFRMHFGSNFHNSAIDFVTICHGCRSRTRVQDHEWQENLRTAIWAWRDHTKKEIGVSDHVLMTTSNGQGMPTKVYEISYLRLCGYDKHTIGSNKCTRSCRHPLGTSLLPVSSSHIAYTPEDNDPCILYRIHFLMISSCCNRRFYTACFCLPHLQQCAEAEIEGRRCCPPQRTFNYLCKVWKDYITPPSLALITTYIT